MEYQSAIEYMKHVQKKGSILGLVSIKQLLAKFSDPQDKISVIHVAGTNGKGSICTFLEAMYRAEGKRIGRYISPTLHCYLERFQINGQYMPEEVFTELLEQVMLKIEEMKQEGTQTPTAFEIETVIAFLYFCKENVDVVILETGMGGRLDATNVVLKPICTVFSSIGMDHMQFLGNTITEIAFEKAGIMKRDCPAVTYPNPAGVMQVLEQQAGLHNVYLRKVEKKEIEIVSETLSESIFFYKGTKYRIGMSGEYQIYNAVTAIETKLLLDGNVIKESLLQAKWEGRFEKISDRPLFIRDGAHNVDGVYALKKSLQKHFTNEQFLFIIGVLKDKEYNKMMEILCPMASKVFVITPGGDRGLSGSILRDSVVPYCQDVVVCISLEDAVSQAKKAWSECEKQGKHAVIAAWGSLSYIGQIKK